MTGENEGAHAGAIIVTRRQTDGRERHAHTPMLSLTDELHLTTSALCSSPSSATPTPRIHTLLHLLHGSPTSTALIPPGSAWVGRQLRGVEHAEANAKKFLARDHTEFCDFTLINFVASQEPCSRPNGFKLSIAYFPLSVRFGACCSRIQSGDYHRFHAGFVCDTVQRLIRKHGSSDAASPEGLRSRSASVPELVGAAPYSGSAGPEHARLHRLTCRRCCRAAWP